jgi:hypothetical protein
MFAAILLAVLPSAPLSFGAPCVCFEVKHVGARVVPEDPFGKAGWDTQRLMQECTKAVGGTDDVFVRVETLRLTLGALNHHADKDPKGVEGARTALFEQLQTNLKLETELAPLSRTTIEVPGDVDAVHKRLAVSGGVPRIERTASKNGLRLWFDASTINPKQIQEFAGLAALPVIEPPTNRPRAIAAITLAFAGQSSTQLGHKTDFDPRALARQATELAPKEPRIAIVAAMVWFDEDAHTTSIMLRDALRGAHKDEWALKNIEHIFCHFYGVKNVEELTAKLDKKLEKG